MSIYFDFHHKPIVAKVNSCIKNTNDLIRKLQNLLKLPDDAILCTTDVVGLYRNIPNGKGLLFLKNALDKRRNKNVSTEFFIELADLVLKKNHFEFIYRFRKQKDGTAIGTKFALPLLLFSWLPQRKTFWSTFLKTLRLRWRNINDIFMIWHHGEKLLIIINQFIDKYHPTIKCTCDYYRERVHFSNVQVILENNDQLISM